MQLAKVESFCYTLLIRTAIVAATHVLKLSKVDVKHARPSSHDLSSSGVSLFREEHIFLFHLSHNIGMPYHLFVANFLIANNFNYLEQVRG